jgi:hypothetical protein
MIYTGQVLNSRPHGIGRIVTTNALDINDKTLGQHHIMIYDGMF